MLSWSIRGYATVLLVLFTGRNQKNDGLAEYFGSICYPYERVLMQRSLCRSPAQTD